MVVLFAVQFPIPEVAAGGEGLLTRRALQTLLVPGRLVDSHQEAVGDGPLAALADGGMRAVGACSAQDESRAVSADEPSPASRSRGARSSGPKGEGSPGPPSAACASPAAAPGAGQPQLVRPSRRTPPRRGRGPGASARRCALPFSGDPALGDNTYENEHGAGQPAGTKTGEVRLRRPLADTPRGGVRCLLSLISPKSVV